VLSSNIVSWVVSRWSGWTVGVAIAVLILIGRVKPVRGGPSLTQRVRQNVSGDPSVEPMLELERLPDQLEAPRPWWRRGLAGLATAALAVALGAVVAFSIGLGAVWLVSNLAGRLK
jgi:hypothetical protein